MRFFLILLVGLCGCVSVKKHNRDMRVLNQYAIILERRLQDCQRENRDSQYREQKSNPYKESR